MSKKWKNVLYVSFLLIITPVLFLIFSSESGKNIAERSVLDKSLLIILGVGLIVFCLWFLGYVFAAVRNFGRDLIGSISFLISLLTGKHKKEMILAEENEKKQIELLAKLEVLNNDPVMSDEEVAERTLLLFKEYGIETDESYR